MTEFISRNHGHSCFEIIIKTTDPEHYKASEEFARRLIDHAKPVTDNNVGCKWIPVTERLPELKKLEDPDGDDWRESEFVLVATAAREVREGQFWKINNEYGWNSRDDVALIVTHWMPLPEPPKEEGQ